MRWTPGGSSEDVEDRRGGGGFGGGIGGRHLGIGGTLLLLVLSVVFKQNLFTVFSGDGAATANAPLSENERATQQPQVEFVTFALNDIQKTWDQLLPAQSGKPYRHAKLVLFTDTVDSACGMAEAATGPFYCAEDEKVYIDLGFFNELAGKFGAPGQFAQAYVVAHEIGHHVQKILGVHDRMANLQRSDPGARNRLSVAVELQADCFAGVWGHSTGERNLLDPNDISDGLRAAASVGDDRLQRMATGHVSPESFTHGSSAQRSASFQRGYQGGDVGACSP